MRLTGKPVLARCRGKVDHVGDPVATEFKRIHCGEERYPLSPCSLVEVHPPIHELGLGALGKLISLLGHSDLLSDAAHLILTSDAKTTTGNFFIDDALLVQHGVTDVDRYSVTPGNRDFIPDFFVD